MFGATRFSTGGRYAGATGDQPYLYHDYFYANTLSLQNLAKIVAGHPEAIV